MCENAAMKSRNITLSVPSDLLDAGRRHAKAHGKSLNGLVRDLLSSAVGKDSSTDYVDDLFDAIDEMSSESIKTKSRSWKRDDAYER